MKTLCTLPKVGAAGKEATKKSKQLKYAIESTENVLHSTLLSVRNTGGFSALHLAAQNGHNQSCREILLAGVDPDVQNNVSVDIAFQMFVDVFCLLFAPDIFHVSLYVLHSTETRRCIQLAATVMRAQREFFCRPNVIHCASI